MLNTQIPGLYILEDDTKGRAVYCSEDIVEGSLIELCPVILLNANDTRIIHNTALHDYYFIWRDSEKTSALALGYGSLYNHSENPNAEFENDFEGKFIRIIALKHIAAHEEICLHYFSKAQVKDELWFKPK